MPEQNDAVFDISPDYDQPVFTGDGAFERNLSYCRRLKGNSSDILIRSFVLSDSRKCFIVCVDGMSDKDSVERCVILASRRFASDSGENKFIASDGVLQQFGVTEISETESLSDGYISALTGDVLVLIENEPKAFIFGYRSIESRSIGDSPLGGSVRGPHEAFTENLRSNTALLRRRISDPNFVIEGLEIGRRSHTSIGLCYILGLTNGELVNNVKSLLESIDIDIVSDSGELEQLLEPSPYSIFPQTDGTELPDVAASELCAGRVAVIVNGSPYVLLLPVTLSRLMKVSEDDYQRWSFASFVKVLRWICSVISVIAPSLYVAMVSFHPGMLPTDLLILTVINRLNVPFSSFIEVLLLELALEVLREASIRMPKNIGASLSIVGGIIIGDAAISAGLISPLLIVVVGVSTMAGFVIPSYSLASSYRLVKYLLLILAAAFGLAGLICGVVIWLSMLTSLRAFGVEYTAPLFPFSKKWALRGFIQPPADKRASRPEYFDPVDVVRYRKGDD